jgi:hypothetical protein
MEPEEGHVHQKREMNLFAYLLLKEDGSALLDEKVDLRTRISSFASQEELVQFDERLKSRGIRATFTRICDRCQKNLSHAVKDTDFVCKRCGFVNDLCEGCQYSTQEVKYNPRTLEECMEGAGCNDALKKVYILAQMRKETQEAPF